MPRTLTLRLDDSQEAELASYMEFSGEKTASKALLHALRLAPDLMDQLLLVGAENSENQSALENMQNLLSELESVMVRGLEVLRQQRLDLS